MATWISPYRKFVKCILHRGFRHGLQLIIPYLTIHQQIKESIAFVYTVKDKKLVA